MPKFFTPNCFNKPFLNIFLKFQKEWVEYTNGQLTVEQIFDITPRETGDSPQSKNLHMIFFTLGLFV